MSELELPQLSEAPEETAATEPNDGATSLPPVLEFLRVLWRLNHELEVTSSDMQRRTGVTAQQRMVLRIVGQTGPIAAGALSRLLHVHPGTLSTTLGRLERRGLVQRTRAASDARKVFVALTPAGETLIATTVGSVERAVANVQLRAAPGMLDDTRDILTRLADELEHALAARRNRPSDDN